MISEDIKSLVNEYADENNKEYLEFLDNWYLEQYNETRDFENNGSIWTKLWFYESQNEE